MSDELLVVVVADGSNTVLDTVLERIIEECEDVITMVVDMKEGDLLMEDVNQKLKDEERDPTKNIIVNGECNEDN